MHCREQIRRSHRIDSILIIELGMRRTCESRDAFRTVSIEDEGQENTRSVPKAVSLSYIRIKQQELFVSQSNDSQLIYYHKANTTLLISKTKSFGRPSSTSIGQILSSCSAKSPVIVFVVRLNRLTRLSVRQVDSSLLHAYRDLFNCTSNV